MVSLFLFRTSEFTTILALQMLILNSGRLQIRLNNMSFGICTPEGSNIRFVICYKTS